MDPNALSWWYPRLLDAGLPMPRTLIHPLGPGVRRYVLARLGGEAPDPSAEEAWRTFLDQLVASAEQLGLPCFVRTDLTSAKHEWDRTCYVRKACRLGDHVLRLVEYSELACPEGLDWSTVVVRETLRTVRLGLCPAYRNMPVTREFRFLVRDGDVTCWHAYWPPDALRQGGCRAQLGRAFDHPTGAELHQMKQLASRAGACLGGHWSVDLLETRRGWHLIDCALAADSWHWPGCPHESG